jgi:hypothetical protein
VPELDKLQKFISEDAFYDSRARFPPPKCHPGTRVEVLRIIEDWIYDPNPSQSIFWLNGPAGAGKSAIIQTIAEHHMDTQLAASFFFERGTWDRGVADRLFPTLVWQLAFSIPEIRPYLESMLRTERSIYAKSTHVQFDRFFVQVFENLLRDKPNLCLQRPLIIIDAVDECATEVDQKILLALIGVEMASQRIPLRFLISSRPEPHIWEVFNTDNMKSIARVLVLDETFGPNNDIRKYLEDEISRIFAQRPPPSVADAINHIVSEASGQFIYASTVVKFIDGSDQDPGTQLNNIILSPRQSTSSPYPQLDQLYIQILSQQGHTRLLKGIFVLILAFGYTDLDLICRRLRINKEDLRLKLRKMHSLLNISDSGIRPFHLSFLDFLQEKKRAGKYYIHPWLLTLLRLPLSLKWTVTTIDILPIAPPIVPLFVTIFLVCVTRGELPEVYLWRKLMLINIGVFGAILILGFIGMVRFLQDQQKETVIRALSMASEGQRRDRVIHWSETGNRSTFTLFTTKLEYATRTLENRMVHLGRCTLWFKRTVSSTQVPSRNSNRGFEHNR